MSSVIHAAAGAAGGITAMTFTYPLIFISTRAAVETNKTNKSTIQAIFEIIQKEGLLGLYAGVSSSLLGIAVTNGTREAILSWPTRKTKSKALSTVESMLSGLIAGTATTIISNPIWVIQVTQATQSMNQSSSLSPENRIRKRGVLQTIKFILRKDGFSAFWRGLGPALILVINPILQYTVFEQLKNVVIRARTAKLRAAAGVPGVATLSDMDFFWLGAFSKLGRSQYKYSPSNVLKIVPVATALTYPYIVVKSRLQADSAQSRSYTSSLDGLRKIMQEEGLHGLYKGVGSKLVQSVLTAAILFAGQRRIYEIVYAATKPVLSVK